MKITALRPAPTIRCRCARRRSRANGWIASPIATPTAACRSTSPMRTAGRSRCAVRLRDRVGRRPPRPQPARRARSTALRTSSQFALSHFALGIVTFQLTYLFRTEPGWNLFATGPTNNPKDGIAPLSGVIETDWLPYPFTMNWQMTRAGTVRFEKDEPICMVFPIPADALPGVEVDVRNLADNPRARRRRRSRGATAATSSCAASTPATRPRSRRLAARLLSRQAARRIGSARLASEQAQDRRTRRQPRQASPAGTMTTRAVPPRG